jgi:hypothetical protein
MFGIAATGIPWSHFRERTPSTPPLRGFYRFWKIQEDYGGGRTPQPVNHHPMRANNLPP